MLSAIKWFELDWSFLLTFVNTVVVLESVISDENLGVLIAMSLGPLVLVLLPPKSLPASHPKSLLNDLPTFSYSFCSAAFLCNLLIFLRAN